MCNTEFLPIFKTHWWLDLVCGKDNWDVVLVEKDNQIYGTLPFMVKKKGGVKIICMPPLTQFMGVYIKYPEGQKYYKKLSWEKQIISALLKKLPRVASFRQNFSPYFSNWLPLYWAGYRQTTRYSYVVSNISPDMLEKSFENDVRRRCKNAEKKGVLVKESANISEFYQLNKSTFSRKGKKIPYSLELIESLYQECRSRRSCKILTAYDSGSKPIASCFLVYDEKTVYYLMGGVDSLDRSMGGMDLVLREAIKFAMNTNRRFDFEGSMIESIEKYFRSFGAEQIPYFSISKINSKIIKLYRALGELIC